MFPAAFARHLFAPLLIVSLAGAWPAVSCRVSEGGEVRLKNGTSLRGEPKPLATLSVGLVDFNSKLKVEINGKQRWNDFVKPDLAAMLDHVRIHGDRQVLYWGVLEFGK